MPSAEGELATPFSPDDGAPSVSAARDTMLEPMTLVRIASRLGLQRRQRDVTPTVEEYLRSKRQELPS